MIHLCVLAITVFYSLFFSAAVKINRSVMEDQDLRDDRTLRI